MKFLFSGSIEADWLTGHHRWRTLAELGHDVVVFAQDDFLTAASQSRFARLCGASFYSARAVQRFNDSFLTAFSKARPEVAWLEWPMLLRAETLRQARCLAPGCTFVSFQDDNPFGSRCNEIDRWNLFIDAIPDYDLHFVKRDSTAAHYARRGARQVRLYTHGVYERMFRPLPRSEIPADFVAPVSFVGTPLDHRVPFIGQLLDRHQIPLRVHGNRWSRTWVYHRRRGHFRPAALGENHVRVICGSRLCLGFVSSSNGDEFTHRSFEIPACRGFLLAERTAKHQEIFDEGREAEFFDSPEECADKVRFYLQAEDARQRIAEAGYQRCLRSNYSLRRRMSDAVREIEGLRA